MLTAVVAYGPSQAIVKGENVGAYSWAVALVQKKDGRPLAKRFMCSGVLVTRSWVLTAGHCIGAIKKGDTVVIGRDKVGSAGTGETRTVANAKRMVDNRGYCPERQVIRCDAALIRLDRNSSKAPLPIAAGDVLSQWNAGTVGRVYGYGQPSPKKPPTLDLRRASLRITELRQNHRTLYAKGINGTQCFGDSGGPFVVSTTRGPRVVGIVRGKNGSCTVGGTESLTKIGWRGKSSNSPVYRWIQSVI